MLGELGGDLATGVRRRLHRLLGCAEQMREVLEGAVIAAVAVLVLVAATPAEPLELMLRSTDHRGGPRDVLAEHVDRADQPPALAFLVRVIGRLRTLLLP